MRFTKYIPFVGMAFMLLLVQLISVGLSQPDYLFRWDEVPGNDNGRVIEFLNQNYGIDWVKESKIEKIDDDKTILFSTGKNYISLKLNDEKTRINIEIDDGRNDRLIVKMENGRLKIYKQELPEAFSNPEDTTNVVVWFAYILVFTAFIFLVIKLNKRWTIQVIILISVVWTLYYVFAAIFASFLDQKMNFTASLILSIGLTAILYKFPEWYVIDIVGIMLGAGAASIFGISLAIFPTLLLLILFAFYDYIAVYRTKHMVALAEGVMDLRLPILLVIPKRWKYSFLNEKFDKEEREAFFMGLGDAVMPTLLVVSANLFVDAPVYTMPLIGAVNTPAIGSIIGTLVGFAVLMGFVIKGKPQAGLPFLNGGVILGYVAGSLFTGSPLL